MCIFPLYSDYVSVDTHVNVVAVKFLNDWRNWNPLKTINHASACTSSAKRSSRYLRDQMLECSVLLNCSRWLHV